MQYDEIMVRYGELSTKGRNQKNFIDRLGANVTKALHGFDQVKIHPQRDRIELFYRNQKKIEKNTGTELEVGYILDLREFPDDPYGDRVVHDIQVILDDPEVGYVAECMGGVNPAFDFVRRCLEAGKSVATSNKQLVAEKGDILLQVAKAHHVNFFFEASVGGAIPIIRPLHTCLAANDISAVAGKL